MASRREDDDTSNGGHTPPKGGDGSLTDYRRRLTVDSTNELDVRLRVGYKTVLLVVVIFDVIHTSIQEVVTSPAIQDLLGGIMSMTNPV